MFQPYHTRVALATIRAFKAPRKGTLKVLLNWGRYDLLLSREAALREVEENPQIEYHAEKLWEL